MYWIEKFNTSASSPDVLAHKKVLKKDQYIVLSIFRTGETVVIEDCECDDKEKCR